MRAFSLGKYLKTDSKGKYPPNNSKIKNVLNFKYNISCELINPTNRGGQLNIGGRVVFTDLETLKKRLFIWRIQNEYKEDILNVIEGIIRQAEKDSDYFYIFKY